MLASESGDVAGVHRSHNDGAYQNNNNGNADGIRATAASPYSSQGPRSNYSNSQWWFRSSRIELVSNEKSLYSKIILKQTRWRFLATFIYLFIFCSQFPNEYNIVLASTDTICWELFIIQHTYIRFPRCRHRDQRPKAPAASGGSTGLPGTGKSECRGCSKTILL